MNKVILTGNLGKDPELKYSQKGEAVCNFSMATKFKDKTEWHNCVAFGKQAEICGQYLKKGSKVAIDGRLATTTWEKDGQRHYKTEIIVVMMEILGGKRDEEPQTTSQPQYDNDVPF